MTNRYRRPAGNLIHQCRASGYEITQWHRGILISMQLQSPCISNLGTFIKSSIAFPSFKLTLKLVELTSVGLLVIIFTSLGKGQHDLQFIGWMDLPHTWNSISTCD